MLRDLREKHELQGRGAKNFYEIHYSDKFTKAHPWGPIPDDEWDEAKEVNPFLYSFQSANLGKLKGLKFSTDVLCHVTHNEQAGEIRPDRFDRQCYTFKPKQKLGKEYIYDGRPLGETYLNTVSFYNRKEFPEFVGVPITPDQMKYQKIPGTDPACATRVLFVVGDQSEGPVTTTGHRCSMCTGAAWNVRCRVC